MKKIKEYMAYIFFILDIFIVILSVWFSFLLRFDGRIPQERLDNFYGFLFLSIIITVVVFFLRKLYEISWKYISITDLPRIFSAVFLSGLIIGTSLFIFRDSRFLSEFPRSIIFLYTILLFLFVTILRFTKRIYWQVLKSKVSLFEIKEFTLPITAETLNSQEIKNVLVTGGAGFIGSVLVRKLLKEGYNVRILDKLLFGEESINKLETNPNFKLIKGDILDNDILVSALSGIDAVVNLAAIVGEPACVCQKDVALQTNYLGAIYVARLCKVLGIKRFIQISTCSTYGQNEENTIAKENSKLFPVDFYGETKIYAERELSKLADENFKPTILRFSTVYGLSPRMRFDLVVNTLTKKAVKEKEIVIFGGDQWRPLVHVSDAAQSIMLVLKAPLSKVAGQIFNVGDSNENYIISDIAQLIKEIIPDVHIKTIKEMNDKRNYRVDFNKIKKVLNFNSQIRVKDGIIEIKNAINSGEFPDLENKKYYNHLIIS